MGKLPFVIAPKLKSKIETLGTDISGKIEIERKGYLTVGEKGFMANAQSQDTVLQKIMKLSRAVSKEFKLSQREAYDAVVESVTDAANCKYDLFKKHADEIAELASEMMVQESKKALMMAYCLLVYRVDEDIDMNDVVGLHEDLINELAAFYLEEEAKSIDRLIEKDEKEEEIESVDIDKIEKK